MIRTILRGLLIAGFVLVLLLVGAAALVQTEPGKRFLAAQLSSLLSTPDAGIEITELQGWIPIDMQLGRLQLSDQEGVWLDATGLVADWSPSALLSGRLQIDALQAKRLHLTRLPESTGEAEQPTDEPFRLPELPTSIPPLGVEKLAIAEIILDAPVLGEAASFELNGSLIAADDGRQADLTVDLQRLDQATAYLTLISTVSLDPLMLAIDLDAGETGNLLERLTGRADAGDLDLSLTGKGPLNDWSGELNAYTEGLGQASADLSLALVDQPHLGIEALVQPAEQMVPPDLSGLLGDGLNVTLAVTQTRAQAITIERIDLGVAQLGFSGSGTVDFERGDLLLKATLNAADLGAMSSVAGKSLAGEARLGLDVGGTLLEPNGKIDFFARGLSVDGTEVSELETTIDWQATAPMDADVAAFNVKVAGTAKGLVVPDTSLPDDEISWQADVDLPLEGAIAIQQAIVKSAGAALKTQGVVDPNTLVSDLEVRLTVPALSALIATYGQEIDGDVVVDAAIATTDNAEAINVDLKAGIDKLGNLPDGARELLGDKLDLTAAISLDGQRYLEIHDLTLQGREVSLQGRAALDLESQDISADIDAALPRLAALASLTEQPLEGAVDLKAKVSGRLDAPVADLSLTSDHLNLADEPIDALSLVVQGRELVTAPEGTIKLDLTARSLPLSLALDYRLDDQILTLPDINLSAPETALSGAVAIDLDTSLAEGNLKGTVGNLAALRPITEQELEGSIKLDATLLHDQGRQNANLFVKAERVGGDFGRIDDVSLTAAAQDLLGKVNLSAKADLRDFEQGELTLSSLTLGTKGDLKRLTIDLDLAGDMIEPFSLGAGGALSLDGPLALDIDRLNGLVAGEALALNGPLHIEQDGERLMLAGLDLHLGQANLKADVDMGERDVLGRVDLRSLPLTWLERFEGPAIDGTAEASVDLSGTVQSPKIAATLDLRDIEADKVTETDLPPVDVTIRADLDDGRLASSLVASRLTQEPVTMSAALPLTLALRPFALEIPEDGKLEGDIKADIQLARIGDLLALDQQVLKGKLSSKLTLAGTIAAPLIEGPITLEEGVYENRTSGTAIYDLTMQADASRERFTIKQFSGKVGDDGTIGAKGWVDLDPDANFPLSASLILDKAKLVSMDEVEATIEGDIAMQGDLGDASITGDLKVTRADISIPEGGGPDLPDIDIEEIGGTIVNVEEPDEAKEPPFDPKLDLTINLPNKIYVTGRGLQSEWQGKLSIAGRSSDPRITGDLSVKKNGYFDFIDKRFDLEEGRVDFSGASPPNPILGIKAVSTEDDFKAIIKLDGPATDPKLTLESEPVLPEDEVLARLLFNRELSEIGPVEAGKLALALNSLRGVGGGFDAFGEVRDALSLDTLNYEGGKGDAGGKLKAGKYLSDDIYFEVEGGASENSGRARVEIEVLPNVSIEADTGQDANGGVGLKWRYNY